VKTVSVYRARLLEKMNLKTNAEAIHYAISNHLISELPLIIPTLTVMSKPMSPPEIARDTLKTLATRKLFPTPDNYSRVYQEISGETASVSASAKSPEPDKTPLAWAELIRELLRQLETPHKGITITRKLETVLPRFAHNPDNLYEKLKGLQRSWSTAPSAANEMPLASVMPASNQPSTPTSSVAMVGEPDAPVAIATEGAGNFDNEAYQAVLVQLREMLAKSLENSLTLQPELAGEIQQLAQLTRTVDSKQFPDLNEKLRHFWIKIELRGEDKVKIQEGFAKLRLLVENVSELVSDDQWLYGQIGTLKEIISSPADKRMIADAERNLRARLSSRVCCNKVLIRLRHAERFDGDFIDRLGELSKAPQYSKIGNYSQKMERRQFK
jgi:diguanylate cyclase